MTRLLIACLLVAGTIAATVPAATTVSAHEWLGLAVVAVLVLHCVVHYDQLLALFRKTAKSRNLQLAAKSGMLFLITATAMACCVSGLCISATVLPSLGWLVDGYFFWAPMHAASAKLLLALSIVHAAGKISQAISRKRASR